MSTSQTIRQQPTVVHLSQAVSIPATGGGYTVTDNGALFPRAAVASVQHADGRRGVDLMLVGDDGVTFTAAEARRLADALRREADLADGFGR